MFDIIGLIFKYFRNGLGLILDLDFIFAQHQFSPVVLGVKSSYIEYFRIFSNVVKSAVTNNDKMQLLHEIDLK